MPEERPGLGQLLREYLHAPEGLARDVSLASIVPNPYQPRRHFDEQDLDELAASLETHGLLQPIVVREGDPYEIIAGERRWRVAERLGWRTIPAIIRPAEQQAMLALALIENLARSNLSPIEEASAYQQLIDVFGSSQGEVADLVGRDRSTVANALRLLDLPAPVGRMLERGELTAGHARALLVARDPQQIVQLAERASRHGWSVRETEKRGREVPGRAVPKETDAEADLLAERSGMRVRIVRTPGRGRIEMSFGSLDQVRALVERLRAQE